MLTPIMTLTTEEYNTVLNFSREKDTIKIVDPDNGLEYTMTVFEFKTLYNFLIDGEVSKYRENDDFIFDEKNPVL